MIIWPKPAYILILFPYQINMENSLFAAKVLGLLQTDHCPLPVEEFSGIGIHSLPDPEFLCFFLR